MSYISIQLFVPSSVIESWRMQRIFRKAENDIKKNEIIQSQLRREKSKALRKKILKKRKLY